MTGSTDLVSRPSRDSIRELAADIVVDQVQSSWEGQGFAEITLTRPRNGGTRKQCFDRFAEGVVWSKEEQVDRALLVFEQILRYARPHPDRGDVWIDSWKRQLDQVREAFGRDGYQITDSLQILRIGAFRPEHATSDAEIYQEALRLLRGARNQLERSADLTRLLDEDRTRDVLLVALNAYFEGRSTGETLNFNGKTDVLVRIGDRNVLVAECKFWRGSVKFKETIDQLLGYLSWQDSRAALLLFIRNTTNPDDAAAKAVAAFKEHPAYVSTGTSDVDERQWTFTVRSPRDAARHVEIALLPFAIA
ncbi:hypothetical protein ACH4TC_18500 [Streptomyces spororaveus]|uniref:hypothetical protein n=1 Tax=Streptomyces spororaveus TaxID=284039 RepID=UPI00379DD220